MSDTTQLSEIFTPISEWLSKHEPQVCSVKVCDLNDSVKEHIQNFLNFLKSQSISVQSRQHLEFDLIKDSKFQKDKCPKERIELNIYRSIFFDLHECFNGGKREFTPKFGISFDDQITPIKGNMDGTDFKYGVIKVGDTPIYYCLYICSTMMVGR